MTWEIRRIDAAHSGLFADGALVVTTDDANQLRLLRLRDRLAAKETADVVLVVRFRPNDPDCLTDVEMDGAEAMNEPRYLALIEAAARRLDAFLQDYRMAKLMDEQPASLLL